MICSLMLDPDDSHDFPGSTATALGRPLAAYPLIAARAAAHLRRCYVVTGTLAVKSVALQNGAVIIDPPPNHGAGQLLRDQLWRGYHFIRQDLRGESESLELLCVLHANCPTVTAETLANGLDSMLGRLELDSAVSVSAYNRMNPLLARRENARGLLEPYASVSESTPGEVWYPDGGVQILRPAVLDAAGESNAAPLSWLGRRVLPLKQWGGGCVDYQWQLPAVEYWLKKNGFADLTPSLELQPKPQPQLAPRSDRR